MWDAPRLCLVAARRRRHSDFFKKLLEPPLELAGRVVQCVCCRREGVQVPRKIPRLARLLIEGIEHAMRSTGTRQRRTKDE